MNLPCSNLLFHDCQVREAGCQAFDANTVEHNVHDLIIILGAAIEHNPFVPNRVFNPHPGPELLLDNFGRARRREV